MSVNLPVVPSAGVDWPNVHRNDDGVVYTRTISHHCVVYVTRGHKEVEEEKTDAIPKVSGHVTYSH